MKIHYNLEELRGIKNPVVTTGSFDGVHIGHKAIIRRLKKLAKDIGGETVLITFHPHPRRVLYPDAEGKDLLMINTQREKIWLQTKCGIRKGYFDFSRDHILEAVNGSLMRLQTEYIDVLLLHRPDTLVEPEEVAEAFDKLQSSGKVRHFGVSNQNPMQIELLKKYVRQPLIINQLQLSLT